MRAAIAADPDLGKHPYDALFASPFLLCRQRESMIDEAAIAKLPESERAGALAALQARNELAARDLAEKARIFTQVHEHFVATFGERCGLKPLRESPTRVAEPASPVAVEAAPRFPLVVWIFTDIRAFTEYHEEHEAEGIASGLASYLARSTGWAFLYDEDGTDREFEIQKCAGLATYSLLAAFARQRSVGPPAMPLPMFFETGLAEWFGAVSMAKDRTLTFVGVNRPRLQSLKQIKDNMSKANKKLFAFTVSELARFTGYADVQRCGVDHWGIDPNFVLGLFYIECWEFLRFLEDADGGKRRAAIGDLLDAWLGRPRVAHSDSFDVVKWALGVETTKQWTALEKEFETYCFGLVRSDESSLPRPPSLEDWPGYVPPTLEPSR